VNAGFFLFFGRSGSTEIEQRLDRFKIAIGANLLRRAGEAAFAPLVAVTVDAEAATAFRTAGAVIEREERPFHFGRELKRVAARHGCQRLVVSGAGAGALLETSELRGMRERLEAAESLVLSNNYYSADLVGLAPVSALDAIDLPATDNPLPRLLHQQGGLRHAELARTAGTLLDVDTPADATVLLRHPRCPEPVRAIPGWEEALGGRIDALMRIITTPERELVVAGRVGAPVWSYLESQTACRVRMLAEERGMQAGGRDASGEARTALGYLYSLVGPHDFFARLAELGDGLVFDTRVLFVHQGWRPDAADRFASDLLEPERIRFGPLAAFTAAARDAGIPALLGGHALVSGVLWTMVEAAWSGHPEPEE